MRFIDFFAGIGGFRRGMELAGHECVGFCEFDKFAAASYTSMHLITEDQRKQLAKLPLKKRQKEILKEGFRNGEWYADDIRTLEARDLPKAGCWCFGAPCQDFSVAGKRAGLDGDRSVLIREIFRLLEEQEEKDRPEWLIYENVKGMLSSNRGLDYLSILSEMDRLGYDIEWQNINSAWYVPQHRERIYTVGHLRRYGRREVLPIKGAGGENRIHQIGNYLPTRTRDNPNQGRAYEPDGIAACLNKMDGGGRVPCVSLHPKIAIPVLTPNRIKKSQNGRRLKENGEPMFTLTCQEQHGVGIETMGGVYTNVSKDFNRGICKGKSRTLKSDKHDAGVVIKAKGAAEIGRAVWHERYQCYIVIRRLTPKECFRLQGWTDDYFEKAQFVNSDNQLYRQAGNMVTVPVVRAIAEQMEGERDGKINGKEGIMLD